MAQSMQTAFEFIQGAYGPMIAVLCTDDAEILCQKNNLNFVELIRPFSQLTSEAHIRDPLNLTHPVRGWKLRFVELSAPTPSKDVVNQLLSDVVSRAQGPDRTNSLSVEDQVKASTPWFEAFRDCFIQVVKPSDHEFIRHFLGCLFVVSSNNTDPLNAFQSLSSALDSQQPSDSIHSKWFSNNIFKYYLMVHDITDGVQNKAEGIYQSMKSYYGSSICHMLMINSRSAEQQSPNLPDPWSQFIIPTSKNTLEMVNDETDAERISIAEEDDEVVVDENFDPLIAVQHNKEKPVLIGPLSFENEVENKTPNKHANNIDGQKSEGLGGTRQFSGGLLSQAGSCGGQHGACLTVSDLDRIKIFIHELAIRGLIPFIEKSMRFLYDQISARKGLHKSFFHATKKWFGGGKPAGQTNTSLVPGIVYDSDSPELLWRKLGDLAFLVQNYDLAYNCYHTAKRDFNANHAWLYFAGALEMASISAFMIGGQRQYPSHYMETSISTYVDACRQHQFATRATLFGVEAFKSRGMYSEAAFALLKMTGEESDLLSAILLEQAAHCFLRTRPPRARKYAFNMILAGHRYSKAAQRKHALRCYKHSLFVYHNKSWRMAEDHINFVVGRQSFNLRQLEEALMAFSSLLLGESLQSAEQQAAYLREFLFVFQQLSKQQQQQASTSPKPLPVLPLPKFHTNSAQIIFTYNPSNLPPGSPQNTNTAKPLPEQSMVNNPFELTSNSEKVHIVGLHSFRDLSCAASINWEQIELQTYERVNQTQASPNFRHFTPCLTKTTNNALKARSIVNETIGVEVMLENELKIPLTLNNVTLLWTFSFEGEDVEKRIGNEFESNEDYVSTEIVQDFAISGNEKKPARLSVTPLRTGNLQILGLKYNLSSVTLSAPVDYINSKNPATADRPAVVSVLGKLDICVRGPRLNSSLVERSSVMYGEDNRLNIVIVDPMPRLKVALCGFPSSLLCGELQKVRVSFSNEGERPLHKLHLASSNANLFAFDGSSSEDIEMPEFQKKQLTHAVERVSKIILPGGCLNSGDKFESTMWVQGYQKTGMSREELLFYYESADEKPSMSYRTVRHQSSVKISKSLAIRATAKRCKVTLHEEEINKDAEENNQLFVTLEVENLSLRDAQFRTFSVLQVSCVSKKWMLKPLSHPKSDGVIIINQGETVMTHFKAVRRQKVSDLSISNLCFTDKETDISCLPYWEFFCRSNTWKELNKFEKQTDSTMSVDLALVALWESSFIDSQLSKHIVRGQGEVAIVTLAESISAPILVQPSTKKKSSLVSAGVSGNTELNIKYTVECPGTIECDFQKRRSCDVTVTVTLHNCSEFTVKAFVEMLADVLPSDSGEAKRDEKMPGKSLQASTNNPHHFFYYHRAYLWAGKRSKQVTLEPSQTIALTFSAKIFKTGVFNLNQCQVLATSNEQSMVSQKPPPPCLLVVRDSKDAFDSGYQEGVLGLFDYEPVVPR